MKAVIINKHGQAWEFNTITQARKYLKNNADYFIKNKVAIFCDMEPCYLCNNDCKFRDKTNFY